MEIRQLRYFVTLAQELHFRKAAEILNITQPPLSQTIKGLEDEIGAPLFERGQRRTVKLTPAGESLYVSAIRILKEVDHARQVALSTSHGETGLLTLAHTDDYIRDSLSDLLYDYKRRYPGTTLRFYQDLSLSMAERLMDGELDCIFTTKPVSALLADCEVRTLTSTPIILAVSRKHRLAQTGKKKVKLKEIAYEEHLHSIHGAPTAFDRKLSDLLINAGVRINSRIQSVSTLIALKMVQRGHGVMLATLDSIPNTQDIAILDIDEPGMALERAVVWKKDNPNPTLKNFLQLLETGGYSFTGT